MGRERVVVEGKGWGEVKSSKLISLKGEERDSGKGRNSEEERMEWYTESVLTWRPLFLASQYHLSLQKLSPLPHDACQCWGSGKMLQHN